MSRYIHQLPEWPAFTWDRQALAGPLAEVRHRQGRLLGRMEGLGFPLRQEAELETLTLDVVKTSEIEGENLNPDQVRSSVARRLGMDIAGAVPADRNVEGVVQMMMDATRNCGEPLSRDRLFGWHAALFPTGHSGMLKIRTGTWRDDAKGPMQVVSGPMGKVTVHYEAPPAPLLDAGMGEFIAWANGDEGMDPVRKAALAH
jgi:Fic family protein